MICPMCDTKNPNDVYFCKECGYKFKNDNEILRDLFSEYLKRFDKANHRMVVYTKILAVFTIFIAILAIPQYYDKVLPTLSPVTRIIMTVIVFSVYFGMSLITIMVLFGELPSE